MKKTSLFLLYFILSMSVVAQTKVIDHPDIERIDSEFLMIHRIELNDSQTILYCNTYHYPNYWCKISSNTVLKGESGKIYKLIRSEGMEMDKEIFMPESGTMPVVLYFEPLYKGEKSFDLIEEDGSDKFYGIKTYKTKSTAPIQCLIRGEVIDRPNSSRLKIVKAGGDFRVAGEYVAIVDGKFECQINGDVEEAYDMAFVDEHTKGSWRSITFFSENGGVSMKLHSMDRHKENLVEGGPLNAEIQKCNAMRMLSWEEFEKEWSELNESGQLETEVVAEIKKLLNTDNEDTRDSLYQELDKLYEVGEIYTPRGKALVAKGDSLTKIEKERKLQYFTNHTSLVGYNYVIERLRYVSGDPLGTTPYIELYNNVYKKKFPKHPYTVKVGEMIRALTEVKEGGKFIDFAAPDFEGNQVILSEQIKGKVALIDLWASWCGPCRRFSIDMKPVYEEFKDKGFTVLAVARESKLSDAVNAYQQDGYSWLSLIDLNDENRVWEKYGIGNAGGATFLVDRDGTILAVNPTADKVREILEEMLQ